MIRSICTTLVLLAFCPSAFAGEIYRHRTADGRIVFTDSPQGPEGAQLVDIARYDEAGTRVRTRVPLPTQHEQSLVKAAESELMQAYSRLTSGVRPLEGEIRKSPEYNERVGQLMAEIDKAQKRLDEVRGRPRILN